MPNKSKPTNLKLVQGSYRKDRANPSEPKTKAAIPTCPKELSGDARNEWKRITKELYTLGLITQVDRAAISAYCSAWGMFVESERQIAKEGAIAYTPNGMPVQSPWLQIRNKSLEQLRSYATEFGMTPSSRTKVQAIQEESSASPWDDL